MQTTIAPEIKSEAAKPVICGKFNGMLAPFQLNCFNSLIASGVPRKSAHKIANDYASDVGRLMASDPDVAQKVGKAKKDGEASLRIGASAKVRTSRSMSLLRVAQAMDSLVKEGLITSRKMPELNTELSEYVQESAEWANAQTWSE